MRFNTPRIVVWAIATILLALSAGSQAQELILPPHLLMDPCGNTWFDAPFSVIEFEETEPPDPSKCPWDVTAYGWCPYYVNGCEITIDVDTMMIYPNGPATANYDIVFVGDGFVGDFYTSGFGERVNEAINAIESMEPYASYACAFNYYQAEIESNQVGADYQWSHGGEDTFECKDTELNMSFGHRHDLDDDDDDDPHYRIVTPTNERCITAACLNGFTNYDMVIVLVNDPKFGGSAWLNGAAPMLFVSVGENFTATITHELAHLLARLGDEYQCGECDCDGNPVGDGTLVPYSGDPPLDYINVSTAVNGDELPWKELLNVDVTNPTDPSESHVDISTGLPIATANIIGRFEGAEAYNENVFRPQLNCHMRCLSDPVTEEPMPFCVVCELALSAALEAHCPMWMDMPLEARDRFPGSGELYWNGRKGFRWPVPKWSGMYDEGADTVTVEIATNATDAELVVVDTNARLVGRAAPGGTVRVRFMAEPFEEYFIQLTTGAPSSDAFTISCKFFVNGVGLALD